MPQDPSSWRQIQQQLTSPAITDVAQRRRWVLLLKKIGLLTLIITLIGGVVAGFFFLRHNGSTIAPYAQSQQKTTLVFFSDGQLNAKWFFDHFGDLRQKGLLSIDIGSVQKTLLKNPQVLSASVERHFPNTLKVTLRERLPLGRVKVKNATTTQIYYVAPDGEFYTSADYRAPATLPFITSADLVGTPDGRLQPLPGALTLAELLDGLKTRYPDLAIQISAIDLKGWVFPITAQTSVALRLRNGTSFRFAGQNISTQIDRLKEVFALLKDEKMTLKNKTVDLTYPDRVAIVGDK